MGKYGKYEIRGTEQLLKAIREKCSGAKAKAAYRKALNAGADMIACELNDRYTKVSGPYRTGGTAREVTRGSVRTSGGIPTVKVGWEGPQGRWRLIHLEEWGYTKGGRQYKPSSYGLIDRTLRDTKKDYFQTIRGELMEFI